MRYQIPDSRYQIHPPIPHSELESESGIRHPESGIWAGGADD
jgi:hypothetical protein